MEKMRKPFLIASLVIIAVVVLIEIGNTAILSRVGGTAGSVEATLDSNLDASYLPFSDNEIKAIKDLQDNPNNSISEELENLADLDVPGLAIRYLALVDGILLFTISFIAAGLFVPKYIQGKTQGVITIIFGVIIAILAFFLALAAFAKVLIMIGMLLAVPFGTIAYFAIYGSFPRGAAAVVLAVLFTLKLFSGGSLLLAHQRFLQNIGLVLLVMSALLANVIVTFLHGFVPGGLVSITDAIAAIVVAIIAIIWSIILIIFSIPSVFKAVT